MNDKPAVIFPVIHLNGDSAKTLIANLKTAYRAVNAACRAVDEINPHQRNFYIKPGSWELYIAQHRMRLQVLHDLQESLLEELKGIQAQAPNRIL